MVKLLLSYRKFFRLEPDFTVYLYHVELEDGPFIVSSIAHHTELHDYSLEFNRGGIIDHLISRGVREFEGETRILTGYEVDREYNNVIGLINDMKDPSGALKRRENNDNYSQISSIASDTKPILNKFLQIIRENRINNIIQN